MTVDILKIVFILIAVFFIYKLIFSKNQGYTLMKMQFKQGRLVSHKGKIQDKFLRECKALAKVEKTTGTLRAYRDGTVRLHISASINDSLAQRMRNMFPFEYYEHKQVDMSKKRG